MKIKNHIILLLTFFTLFPIVLLKFLAYPRIQRDLQVVIMENLDVIGNKQAELVSTWMRERMKDVIVLASNPFMANSVSISEKDARYGDMLRFLQKVANEYGYMGAFVCDGQGVVKVATVKENVGRNVSDTDYFKNAIQGKTFASSIVPSDVPLVNEFDEKEVGLPTMLVSSPLKDVNEDIIGAVVLRIHVGFLSNLMQSYKFGQTGETYLVSKEGYMLTESRFTSHLKKMEKIKKRSALELKLINPDTGKLTEGVRKCIAGKDGSDSKGYTDYGGVSVLGVWRWLPEYNWGVITEIDRNEAYGAAHNLKNIVVAILLAIAFPLVLIAYLVGGRFSRPIIRLTEITEKMASGDLTQRVSIKSGDNEIGKLSKSFNMMAGTLDEKMKEMSVAEMRYRALFDSLKAGIYECEPGVDGVFTWVNHAAAEMFGYETPAEMIGTKVKDIYVDPDERKKLVEKLEKDEVWKDFASYFKKKNGEKFYAERTSVMMKDADGKPIRISGMFRDITDQKKIEEEQKKAAAAAAAKKRQNEKE